ncbi:hypothetical protein [Shewanella acanthi]|uniref:hypothetical protein n=1 Tax=Shewanella acanthi TaxID=2864212 RepID=UPI001C661D46|nr:hypothetical protein [Shewanella acanthi]QYJ78610.1 hypothetical protein K0H61_16225 [Shewanella acanthi]
MQKFTQYASILACCLSSSLGIARADDTATATPASTDEANIKVNKIVVISNPIFDESDPDAFFIHRWANYLHVNTKDYVILDRLTFDEKETVSQKDLDESQRLLRAEPYIRDAKVYVGEKDPEADTNLQDQSVIIETWDNWSLLPTASFSHSGGDSRYSVGMKEDNLFGTGIRTRVKYQSDESRTGYKFAFEAPISLIDHGIVAAEFYDNSDGQAKHAYLSKPFYALDTTSMYTVEFLDDTRTDIIRQNGSDVNEFEHTVDYLDLQYGWLINKNRQNLSRIIAGFTQDKSEFANSDSFPTSELPDDRDFMYPWIVYEFIEDNFKVLRNVHLIANHEDFNLGWHHFVKLGVETKDIRDNSPMGYHFNWLTTKGFQFDEHLWLLEMGAGSNLSTTQKDTYKASIQSEFFYQINRKWTAYTKAWASFSNNTYLDLKKGLGDETGVRGYPNEYQQGDNQWSMTAEIRNYPNINLYQLAELGWAVFADVGQATGGPIADNNEYQGVLSSVGIGARLYSSRSSYGNIAHIDFSVPLTGGNSVSDWEWRVLVKNSF